jgi:hypothetical protein
LLAEWIDCSGIADFPERYRSMAPDPSIDVLERRDEDIHGGSVLQLAESPGSVDSNNGIRSGQRFHQ